MHTAPLTGTRYPDTTDAPNVPQFLQYAVADLEDNTIPRFASTAARDTAYSNWTAAGNSMASGLVCFTQSDGRLWRYDTASSSWLYAGGNPPPIVACTAFSGWQTRADLLPVVYKDASGLVHMAGSIEPQTTYNPQDGGTHTALTLPVGYRPATVAIGLLSVGGAGAVQATISTAGVLAITGGTSSSVGATNDHWLGAFPPFHPGYTGVVLS